MGDSVQVQPFNKVGNDQLQNGPIGDDQRECRDILFCLAFLANIFALWSIASYGWSKGTPERLVGAYDGDGKACGLDRQEYPYLYFVTPHPDWINRTLCVKTCPNYTTDDEYSKISKLDCAVNRIVNDCSKKCDLFTFTVSGDAKAMNVSPEIKPANFSTLTCVYNSTIVLNRLCWPTGKIMDQLSEEAKQALVGSIKMDQLAEWINDLKITWRVIAGSVGIALFLGGVYMLFLRIFAGLIVWICIVAFFVILIALGYLSLLKSKEYQAQMDKAGITDADSDNDVQQNQDTFLYMAYVIWGITGCCLIAFFCMFDKIRLAIAVIKTATLYVRDVPLSMLVPPVFTIVNAAYWMVWIFGLVYIYSVGEFVKNGNTPLASVVWDENTKQMLWYYLFGGLWCNAFIQAINQFILASTVCMWYFTQGPNMELHRPISRSIYRAFRYHLGSLAFGALILAIVQFIQIILEYIAEQMKRTGMDKNKCLKYLVNCLRCCMACFERFIKFLNKNAYIQIALEGQSFCGAAKDAMEAIWANAARVSFVNGIGGAFIFIGKAFICIATVIICYLILNNVSTYKEISSPFLTCLIVFFISYGTGSIFMSVYGMAIDSILLCFIHDEALQKGRNNAPPKHCPELLKDFFAKEDAKHS